MVASPSGVQAIATALDLAFPQSHMSRGEIGDLRICFKNKSTSSNVNEVMRAAGVTADNLEEVLAALTNIPGWDGDGF